MGAEIINHKPTHVDRETSALQVRKLMQKSGTKELLVTGHTLVSRLIDSSVLHLELSEHSSIVMLQCWIVMRGASGQSPV